MICIRSQTVNVIFINEVIHDGLYTVYGLYSKAIEVYQSIRIQFVSPNVCLSIYLISRPVFCVNYCGRMSTTQYFLLN